jgi:co-chaperonin GroES (HSP10)
MTKTNVIPTKVFALEKKNKETKEKEKKPEHSKLPNPSGWRLLVMPFKLKEKSKGGIILTDKTVEESQWSTNVGLVMKMGDLCFKDDGKFPTGPWCKEKDWILFGRYAGARIKIDGGELRLLNDDEVMAVVKDPEYVLSPLTN